MGNKEIYEWLAAKKYQTERNETGEYLMYFGVDMPKILSEYKNLCFQEAIKEIGLKTSTFDPTFNSAMLQAIQILKKQING